MDELPERYRELRNLLIGAKERGNHIIVFTGGNPDTRSNKLTGIHGKVVEVGKDYVLIDSVGVKAQLKITDVKCVYFED